MINEIFSLAEKYAGDIIKNNPDVPDTKKNLAIETTTDAIKEGIKGYLNPTNISALAGMLSGNKGSSESNSIVDVLKKSVTGALSSKAGLNSTVSSGIAATLIPTLIGVISKKMNDPGESSFNVGSLISAFTQNNSDEGGGILGTLGKLFNK